MSEMLLDKRTRSKMLDLTGKRFGKLVAIERLYEKGNVRWRCLCDCGNETAVKTARLRSGKTKSCGCGMVKRGANHAQYNGCRVRGTVAYFRKLLRVQAIKAAKLGYAPVGESPEAIAAAYAKHDKVCPVCKTPEADCRNGSLVIDHDHETGEFRDFVCDPCNRAAALVQDDPRIASQLAKYLEAHR